MPSEFRLHPLSFVFELGTHAKTLLWPGILALFAASSGRGKWEVWLLVLLIPHALAALARALSFRYVFGPGELVIRTGFIFRRERHIPYDRIQNIDATQNVAHRLLDVVAVRVETGGGTEAEAQLKVLSGGAFRELRERIFAGREAASPSDSDAGAAAVPRVSTATTLVSLSPREIALWGFIRGQGLVVVAAGFGVLVETGVIDRLSRAMFGDSGTARGVLRQLARAAFGQGVAPTRKVFVALGAFLALLLVMRVLSMALALVRFHGFTLVKAGDDLRSQFGLLTRVSASIPSHRIQTLTLHEGPLHRLFTRASLSVETAGGEAVEDGGRERRQWLVPIVRSEQVATLVRSVLPVVDFTNVTWRPMHPRAFRREFVRGIVVSVLASLPLVAMLGWWTLAALALLVAWASLEARWSVARMGWGLTDHAVVYRSGWLWRRMTAAPIAKVQVVSLGESPFDRRHGMASLNVDTAGAGDATHRVRIPYLSRDDAEELRQHLASAAARTTFEW
jgi:putative membrane protein